MGDSGIPKALKFLESLGFAMTGESERVKVGIKFVRLIYMERVNGQGQKENTEFD